MLKGISCNKLYGLLLAFLILCCSALPANGQYSGGLGTPQQPWQIANLTDLSNLAANFDHYTAHFILTADIDMTGYTNYPYYRTTAIIAPSPGFAPVFNGTFDGNSHIITNLTLDASGNYWRSGYYLGLFGRIGPDGVVKNLGVENITIIAGDQPIYLAALAAENNGDIINCYATGSITGGRQSSFLGGLVANNNPSGTISDSYAACSISSGYWSSNFGGLAGANSGTISNCYATGFITDDGDSEFFGGLVGNNYYGSISNSYATGFITSISSQRLGGLVGENHRGTISDCYATGSVTANGESKYLGGLMGYNYDGDISNCFATGSVTGEGWSGYLGGLVGRNSDGSISNCYATGNVTAEDGPGWNGGLVGVNGNGSISYCYATGTVKGSDSYGLVGLNTFSISNCFWDVQASQISTGIGYNHGTITNVQGILTDQMWAINTFLDAEWDFTNETVNGTDDIWQMPPVGYPALSWQSEVAIPDVTGMTQVDAQNTLITAKLNIGAIKTAYSATIPSGNVINQFPPAGTNVADNSSVQLVLSVGLSPFDYGTGTKDDPIQIANVTQLQLLADTPTSYDMCFILTADIDLTGTTYPTALIAPDSSTINDYQGPSFTGTFDGNGHTISNLTIAYGNYLGLFGEIGPGGIVKNLRIDNVAFTSSVPSYEIGGLAGRNRGIIINCSTTVFFNGGSSIGGIVGNNKGVINSCNTTGSINAGGDLGGLVGYNEFGIINNCSATTSVTGGWAGIGGLAGRNDGIISNCFATGEVNGDGLLGGLVGNNDQGIIRNSYAQGAVYGQSNTWRLGGLAGGNGGTISNCYATGAVTGGDNSYSLGGLVGDNEYGSISNCYAIGDVNAGNNSHRLGGLVGSTSYYSEISNCFWDMQTCQLTSGFGIKQGTITNVHGKTTAEMQTKSTFTDAGWDFTTPVWAISEGGYYPRLVWPLFFYVSPTRIQFTVSPDDPNSAREIVKIQYHGSGTLPWEVFEDCSWLEVFPVSGETTDGIDEVINLQVNASGLIPGNYNCSVTVSSDQTLNNPQVVGVMLHFGGDFLVPDHHDTIQAAIDAAWDNDTVVVADGTYTGEGNRDLDFHGKAITVRSANGPANCIIDCQATSTDPHRGFYFRNNETSDAVVDGFTIINGNSQADMLYKGGGIYCWHSSPTIKNCIIKDNYAEHDGGGIAFLDSTSRVINCLIIDNTSNRWGGGLFTSNQCNIEVINCTVAGNSSVRQGGGFCSYNSNNDLTNSILWNNTSAMQGQQITVIKSPSTLTVLYSDVQEGPTAVDVNSGCTLNWLTGNIDTIPFFADPNNDDYHLQPASLCIDAAKDAEVYSDIENNSRPWDYPLVDNNDPNTPDFDMGAYEFTATEFPMKFTPQTLNCSSNGKWIKAHFTLPDDFTIEDVNTTPVRLEPFNIESSYIEASLNSQGVVEVEIAFDRQDICQLSPDPGPTEITVLAQLTDGQYYFGTDTIRIIDNHLAFIISLTEHWLQTDCAKPNWCDSSDLNQDSFVNLQDFALYDN